MNANAPFINGSQADPDALAPAEDDDALLAELKVRFTASATINSDNHREGLDDLTFLAGDHWPAKVKRERELDGRPCLTVNKLPTFLHQVTNDQRQNVPSIKVSPVDDNADVETAKIIQGIIRNIEYQSNADVAYDTAVNSAAAIGFGYFRLVTDYCSPESFDQEIRFKRIRNPFTVYFDPASEEPDGSDATFAIISGKVPRYEFKRLYPHALASNDALPAQAGDGTNKEWIWQDSVRLAEYYRIEWDDDTLVLLPDGTTEFKSALAAAGVEVPEGTQTRPTQRKKVMFYKCTALEVLERTEILCDWIPVFPVYGDELDIDGKVIRSGLVRNAKDPSRMYDFWMTAATEEVALRPKIPYIGAEGQFAGHEDDWESANVRSLSYLEYKPVTLDGVLAPAPQRQPMADMPVGTLQMAMHANDNIKATTGLFDSSIGARGNAQSGIQERQQQRQGDVANFHYADNLSRTVRHAGRCIVSMIPGYYDGTRIVRTMGEDGKQTSEKINQPATREDLAKQQQEAQQAQDEGKQAKAIRTILNDVTVGKYDVVIKAGPSYDTLRQEALDGMVQVAGKWPKLMDVAGDLVIKSMDWPGADQIAERVGRSIPPELLGDEDADKDMVQTPKGPVPKDQVGPMLEEMNQQVQELGKALQEAKSGIEKARIQSQTSIEVAEINAVSKADVAELNGWIQMLLAQIQPPPVLTAKALTEGSEGGMEGAAYAAAQPSAEQPPEPRPAVGPIADQALEGAAIPEGDSSGQGIAP